MSNETVGLQTLLVAEKAATVDYPGLDGFKLDLAFLARESLVKIRKKATKVEYKNRQPIETLNDDLFLKLYVEGCIKGWEGLTFAHLATLAPVDISKYKPTDTLAFSPENALYLMKSSTNFDSFISETVTDLANFQ